MQTQNVYQIPSFSIFKAPGKPDKVETLIHCFIERKFIDTDNPPATIKAGDGWVYQCVYDCRFFSGDREVEVIISFQNHTYGRFAIIRMARDGKEAKDKQTRLI